MDESASQPPVPDPEAGAVPLADTSGALPASKTTAHALTPPTSEDLNPNKHDDGSSELSELDMDEEDDIGDIEPDHYFGDGKIPVFKPVSSNKNGRSRPFATAIAMRITGLQADNCALQNGRPWTNSEAFPSLSRRSTGTA